MSCSESASEVRQAAKQVSSFPKGFQIEQPVKRELWSRGAKAKLKTRPGQRPTEADGSAIHEYTTREQDFDAAAV